MPYYFIVVLTSIYLGGIVAYLNIVTMPSDLHRGGNREVKPADVRWSLIWPIFAAYWIPKTLLWGTHYTVIPTVLLLFGFYYKDTKMFERIDKYLE